MASHAIANLKPLEFLKKLKTIIILYNPLSCLKFIEQYYKNFKALHVIQVHLTMPHLHHFASHLLLFD